MYSSNIVLEIRDISAHQRLGLLNLARFAAENQINVKREIEKAGTQLLLSRLLNNAYYDLCYTEHKKPFLRNRTEKISISHSHDILAVLISQKEETGVDVELLRDKVLRVRHKFLNHDEQRFANADITKLIILWAAKEAMYKVYGRRQLDFKNHMSVAPFTDDLLEGTLIAEGRNRKFSLKWEKLGNYILVYTLNEI